MSEKKNIWILCPAYNENSTIQAAADKLTPLLNKMIEDGKISPDSKILFVDDGSIDNTWNIIKDVHEKNNLVKGLKLVRNVGQQKAILAGLEYAKDFCDAVLTLDVDLQDDISKLEEFIDKFYSGYEVVYGAHNKRQNDSFLKRTTACWYYFLMEKLLKVPTIPHHSECRLVSKNIIERILQFKESDIFLRELIMLASNKYEIVEYERQKRICGKTKYSYAKLVSIALKSIVSTTTVPLKFVIITGIIVLLTSIFTLKYGFTTFSIWFLAGTNIFCLGLVGEYISEIYIENKKHPKYFVEEIL